MADHERKLSVLRAILGFGILTTALHFTHNFVAIDSYPDDLIAGSVIQVAILVSWPLFTGLALYGYRLYARGRYASAHGLLLAYAFFALTSLGHFLDASPDIPAFWFATIFTDVLAGLAMAAFVAWSAAGLRRRPAAG